MRSEKEIDDLMKANPDKEYDIDGCEVITLPNKKPSDFRSYDEYLEYVNETANTMLSLLADDVSVACNNDDVINIFGGVDEDE